MKRTIYLATVIALAACLLTGCKKEDGRVFRLQIQQYGGDSKTSLTANNQTAWTVDDIIYVNGTGSSNQAPVRTEGTGTRQRYIITLDEAVTAIGGNYYAFYAGKATDVSFDRSTKSFTYTLPNEFTYNANVLEVPMAGMCADGAQYISFSNLCAMLKLSFVVAPTKVIITSASPLYGTFTATYDETNQSWASVAASTGESAPSEYQLTINNTGNNTDIYVPLPAGNTQLTITWQKPNGKYSTISMSGSANLQASNIYPKVCAYAFTVSDNGDQIYFAPGNLQFIGTATPHYWKFADHQYDFLGASQQQAGANRTAEIFDRDLFTYGTSNLPYDNGNTTVTYTPWGSYTNAQLPHISLDGTTLDWGANVITYGTNTYQANTWRTPTSSEWEYLIAHTGYTNITHKRLGTGFAQAGILMADNTTYQNGLIIFPDGYTCPSDIRVNVGWSGTTATDQNIWPRITLAQWAVLEANGCIFLPATGRALADETALEMANQYVCYQSSTWVNGTGDVHHPVPYGRGATLNMYTNDLDDRGAVRLVRTADLAAPPTSTK